MKRGFLMSRSEVQPKKAIPFGISRQAPHLHHQDAGGPRMCRFGMKRQVLLVLGGTFHTWGLLLSLETLRFVLSSFPFQRAACVQFVYSPPSPTRGYFSITAIIREAPRRFQAQVKWLSSLRLPGRQSGASLSNEKGVHGYPHAA